jgi:hypothetical protein
MTTVKEIVSGISVNKIETKTGKILLTLIRTQDKNGWVSAGALKKYSSNLSSLRDLRRPRGGEFTIEVAKASEIGKKTDSYYYRLVLSKKDVTKIKQIFSV